MGRRKSKKSKKKPNKGKRTSNTDEVASCSKNLQKMVVHEVPRVDTEKPSCSGLNRTGEQATDNYNIQMETMGIIESIIIANEIIPPRVATGSQTDDEPIYESPESRVPYITNPKDFMGPTDPSIPYTPIFTLEKIYNEKVNPSIFKDYKLHCITKLTRPKAGFEYVYLLPGIFTLSLGITYEDDYKIMRVIYPTLELEHPDYNYIKKKCYLLEEKVLEYLDNFRTNLICKIFDSIIVKKNFNLKYITESEYLEQMKDSFDYSHTRIILDSYFTYCAKENKSKYCPGMYSKIEKKFRKQNFE
ncbi:hypothetical protein WA026_006086 [Henosepilachna vigintioctopunctata]|uniref:Uncharacterized protein n=1 Tax=Henosepilachna vigintioctopunctata TaxID=420089 RepID=A0AAW1TPK2_9CUCU